MIRIFIVIIYGLLPMLALAQASSEFNIRMFVGSDTEAPTTPSGVTVNPVSPNQIDISWTPVTDNFSVGGYRVFRDGLHISTTSLTTFSDTGLVASTSYSYTIDAFDVFYNVSSSSSPVSTTTLPIPVVPVATSTPTTTSAAGDATAVPAVRSFLITPANHSAKLTFFSYGPNRYLIRFGRTEAYELGGVSTNVFKTNHETTLSGLEPGTKYYVEVTLVNGFGIEKVVRRESFTTLPAITSTVPLSASQLRGVVDGRNAILTWTNPDSFASVRVVRNHLFYPADIYDGVTVYQGTGEDITDKNVFVDADTVYYAVFVITADGRVAAPAVLRLKRVTVSDTVVDGSTSSQPVRELPLPDLTLSPEYERFLLPSDIFFTIGNETKSFDILHTIVVDKQVLVSIPAAAVPTHLKTILVSVYHPTNNNEVTTYLLKLRGDGEAYEASFQSSSVVGEGKVMIELYDYERVVVRRISRTITYVSTLIGQGWVPEGSYRLIAWSIVSLLAFGIFILLFVVRRRREDNQ